MMRRRRGNNKIKRKRLCRFCEGRDYFVDFRDDKKLVRFLTEQGKIIPRRTSGNCKKHQKQLVSAIKRARHMAILPFVSDIPR